jgi:hypothetical protein
MKTSKQLPPNINLNDIFAESSLAVPISEKNEDEDASPGPAPLNNHDENIILDRNNLNSIRTPDESVTAGSVAMPPILGSSLVTEYN